jgi:hypothetical protein
MTHLDDISPVIRLQSGASFHGIQLIEAAARIEICERFGKDNLVDIYLGNFRTALDALERDLAAYEASRIAKVEIKHPVDDHQTDIDDGTASFEAYREKMRSV